MDTGFKLEDLLEEMNDRNERSESGKSVLAARHDDNDDCIFIILFKHTNIMFMYNNIMFIHNNLYKDKNYTLILKTDKISALNLISIIILILIWFAHLAGAVQYSDCISAEW